MILSLLFIKSSFSENKVYIVLKVNEHILTNLDIERESKYLMALNPNLAQLPNNKILEISKESLINEIIKKKEIEKIFSLEEKNLYVDDYLKNIYKKLNFNNKEDFENYLINSANYTLSEVKGKIKIEIMWNELIYLKYFDQVKVNKKKLIKKIENLDQANFKEYLLSEISFKKIKDQDIDQLINKIYLSISDIGFNNTATIFSISESAKLGGKIGWIKENNLSKLVSNKLKNLNEGQHTKVIQIGNNFLILKVEEIRQKKITINKQEELNKMIKFETNKQLNQFSKIFFDKSKINYSINEK